MDTNIPTPTAKTQRRLKKLKDLLPTEGSLLIILQDNPDPDAMGAAVALRHLVRHLTQVDCVIAHGGTIGRAENRALARYLNLTLLPLDQVDLPSYNLMAMVDTQPGTGNNSLPAEMAVDIVIDHHPLRETSRKAKLLDIRRLYGATATILLEYLLAADITPDRSLATAMIYAIRSDTQDLGRDASAADIRAIQYLYPLANLRALSDIQRGRVVRSYFRYLQSGLQQARSYGNCIITRLGQIDNPDMIGEIADLLLRDDHTEWVLCVGVSGEKLLLSLRTSQSEITAEMVMRQLVDRRGTGGGHQMMAGGQLPLLQQTEKEIDHLEDLITKKMLSILDIPASAEQKLCDS